MGIPLVLTPRSRILDLAHRYTTPICLAIYLGATGLRIRSFAFEGRFWAEDGAVFFPAMHDGSPLAIATFLHNGHLELITNAVIWASTLVPFRYAPITVVYTCLVLQLLIVWYLLSVRVELGLSAARTILLVTIAASIPQGAEVWVNACNLHFHFALFASFILAANHDRMRSSGLTTLLLLCCGLSGIPANVLAPLFGLKALLTKSRRHAVHFAAISCTAALQGGLLLLHPVAFEGRQIELHPVSGTLAYLSHTFVRATFTPMQAQRLIGAITLYPAVPTISLLVLTAFFVVCAIMFAEICVRGNVNARQLLLVSTYLAAWFVVGALGTKEGRIDFGGRYFYASVVLAYAALLAMPPGKWALGWLWLAATLYHAPVNSSVQFEGPAWFDALKAARTADDSSVRIWPKGWHVPMP